MNGKQTFLNIDSCNPSQCISRKMNRLNRITANIFRKYLQPFNITDSQLTVLFILAKKGGLSQKSLCEITNHEKSSINRNLKRMIDNDIVTREDFPIIKITAKGKTQLNNIIPHWEKAMAEIRAVISNDGEDALNLLMNKFSKR